LKKVVLFLCVANSARSQLAEAIFREAALKNNLNHEVYSAGTEPSRVHPLSLEILKKKGVCVEGLSSKAINDLSQNVQNQVTHVYTLCKEQNCPIFLSQKKGVVVEHIPFEDPVKGGIEGFEKTYYLLEKLILEKILKN